MCLACSHHLLFSLPTVNLWINSDVLQCYYLQFPQSVLLHMSSWHFIGFACFFFSNSLAFWTWIRWRTQYLLLRFIQKGQLLSWSESFQVGLSDLCVEGSVSQTWRHTHRFGLNAGSGLWLMRRSSKMLPFSSRCFLYVEAREPTVCCFYAQLCTRS